MTMREAIAMEALQGLLAPGNSETPVGYVNVLLGLPADTICAPGYDWVRYIAECSVRHADALLLELAKPVSP
jgi:hypothetical protein